MRSRMLTRTLGAVIAFATTAAGVLLGLSAGSAEADGGDLSAQAGVERVLIRGHGYGHGHGMSQYGAQGAALQGRTYRQIADFYYPGTAWAQMRGRVRVLITGDTTSEVIVSPVRNLTVRDRAGATTYRLPVSDGISRWRLGLAGDRTVIEKLSGGHWSRYNPPGDSAGALVGVGEFLAAEPMTLWLPDGSTRKYRGLLRAAPPYGQTGSLDTVNALSMDAYLQGVVPYEMPASWHPEAVKAQSIAARTYATWSRNQNRSRYYQICDTTSCQVYGGASGEDYRSNVAVAATSRQILTYGGEAAFTQFSSSSGGWTAKGSVPYLPAKRDPYDGWSGNPMHSWSTTVDASRLERMYPRLGTLRDARVTSRTGDGDWGGRVVRLVLDGSDGDVTMSGDSLRWALGLRSNWFKFD
ncbi:MAG: SpoIID/LytB domain-containing protein [Actinomycetota bacterium]|nr:SpoIID/LytB domain-containing protein [Actinomycetota bacterium]